MRRIFSTLIGALALASLLTATAMPALAADYERSFTATVDQIRVNRTGGITINGTLDCTAAVSAAYGGTIPEHTFVLVSVSWDAYQMVGRNKVIHAEYRAGIASLCYTNDPSIFGENDPDLVAPWVWRTQYAFPMGTEQWVYSTDGKFSAGLIHVELHVSGVTFTVGEDNYTVYNFSGWDLRATKVR